MGREVDPASEVSVTLEQEKKKRGKRGRYPVRETSVTLEQEEKREERSVPCKVKSA